MTTLTITREMSTVSKMTDTALMATDPSTAMTYKEECDNEEERDDYRPPRVPYETERFEWDYDDCGVLCRYSKEEERWTSIESPLH